MWEQIGAAAIYGALGGGGGTLIGLLVAALFSKTRFAKIASTIFVVAGAVLGINFAEPLLKPYIGQYLPQAPSQATAIDGAIEEIRSDPFIAAVWEKEPEMEAELRTSLGYILATEKNPTKARNAAFVASRDLAAARLIYYLQRGRDEDLIAFASFIVSLMNYWTLENPHFCHQYFYNSNTMAEMSIDEIKSKFGGSRHLEQQDLAAEVVRNSYEDVPAYDAEGAQIRINEGGVLLYERLGDELIGLIAVGGQLPKSDEEAAAACAGSAEMYQYFLESENAEDVLRHLFVLSS